MSDEKIDRRFDRWWNNTSRDHKLGIVAAVVVSVVVVAAIGVTLAGGGSDGSDDEPDFDDRMTLTEAACEMLRVGDDPQFVYDVTRDLAADHSLQYPDPDLSARLAVRQAQSQGCG